MRMRPPLQRQVFKADLRTAETVDKGHGRVDKRRMETLSRLPSPIDFPGAKQIGRIHRERINKGIVSSETICFITSLPRLRANASALLNLARSHWSIENGIHRVRDVTFGEDACTVTTGSAPQVLAALRNASITLLRRSGIKCIALALRRMAAHPAHALELLDRSLKDF